ncbi:hypothetical protein niasHT_020209 [Heterodera trifolii]|uniref:ZP domain-containing protein n=1 Tax=Heterodera trifolii TaxID=157864 RepID=A0ABD2JGY8_9BILA
MSANSAHFLRFPSPFTASTSASSTKYKKDGGLGRKSGGKGEGKPHKKHWGHAFPPLSSIRSTDAFPFRPSARSPPAFPSLIRLSFFFLFFVSSVGARLLDTSVACDQHNFLLSLNFDVPFRGLVYSEEGFPNCVYVNGTMLSHINYHLKIPLFGCETHTNADGNFENGIIIQDNAAFLQSSDKKYLLTCIPSSPAEVPAKAVDSVQRPQTEEIPKKTDPPPLEQIDAFARENTVTVDFGGVSVEQGFSSTEPIGGSAALSPLSLAEQNENSFGELSPAPVANSATDFKYKVEIRAGHSTNAPPIDAALNIGDKISYVVRLQKPISESQIGRCWASDPKSSLELSDEHGCSLQPRGNIWGQFDRTETDSEMIFTNRIKAWAFPTSNEVNIFCNLRVCMSHHCSFQTNCSATQSNGEKRKRRSAGGEFAEVETLKTRIRIRSKRKTDGAENSNGSSAFAPFAFAPSHQIFDDANGNWCISPAQLFLIGACCCAFSLFLSVGIGFLLFTHCSVGKCQNSRTKTAEDEIWSTIAELSRRSRRRSEGTECQRNAK